MLKPEMPNGTTITIEVPSFKPHSLVIKIDMSAATKVRDMGQSSVVDNGGIDLNAKNMEMDVAKDGRGVEMTFDPAMVAEFRRGDFTGVEGVILNIVPIANPLLLLGLEASPADKQLAKG